MKELIFSVVLMFCAMWAIGAAVMAVCLSVCAGIASMSWLFGGPGFIDTCLK